MEIGTVDLVSFDQAFAWRHWAVWYFLLVGTAVGALLIAFMASRRDEDAPPVRPALFAAAACGITSPFPLLADLHQPARFMNFYLGTAYDSIMWWGSWFLPGFIAGLAVLVFLYAPMGARFTAYRRYVWYWTALFGIAVLAYTAGEMTIVRARPVWHNPFFPVLLSLSALVSGAGAVSIAAAVRGENPGVAPRVMGLGSLLFVIGILAWLALGSGKAVGDGGAFAALAFNKPFNLLFLMTGVFGVGAAALTAVAARKAAMSAIAGTLAVLGGLVFRWELFMGGQAQPKTEAGFFPYSFFGNADALAGLIGTVGLLAVIVVVLSFFLVSEDERGKNHAPSNTAL